ncbi:hypothetical protein [Acidovorax sp. Leaf78]|uniref:hypothetical protein n=1 Tax=Acidovorax sp. Leaf78 TaxID=1736237 RepID=UPI000AD292C7|nr:hypothetical protein [Acidovorax sp. Leaf78]
MLLKIALKIPFVQCVAYFPFASHRKAALKFFFLLVATSLPILAATVLTAIPAGAEGAFIKFVAKIGSAINISELFVYATTFLAPYLYLIFERYKAVRLTLSVDVKNNKGKIDLFPGYFFVLGLACLLIVATAIAFGLIRINSPAFLDSFLYRGLDSYAFWVYIFGLYCWYLTLLDEAHDPAVYGAELGNGGADVTAGLAERLAQRG